MNLLFGKWEQPLICQLLLATPPLLSGFFPCLTSGRFAHFGCSGSAALLPHRYSSRVFSLFLCCWWSILNLPSRYIDYELGGLVEVARAFAMVRHYSRSGSGREIMRKSPTL
jgi:hypothetical protein